MRHAIAAAARTCALAAGVVLGLWPPGLAADALRADGVYPWQERHAPVPLNPAYVLPKLSTLGVGFEYRYQHSPRFGMRVEAFGYEGRREEASGLLRAEFRATLRSRSLLFDWFVLHGRFRATTGIYIHRSELHATAYYEDLRVDGISASAEEINGVAREIGRRLRGAGYERYGALAEDFAAGNTAPLRIDGANLPLSELAVVSAYLRFPPYAPYIGIGWANEGDAARRGLFYSIDLGLMDLGEPRVEYSLSGTLVDALRTHYASEVDALIAEKEEEAERKLREYRYYPVVSLGIGYRF